MRRREAFGPPGAGCPVSRVVSDVVRGRDGDWWPEPPQPSPIGEGRPAVSGPVTSQEARPRPPRGRPAGILRQPPTTALGERPATSSEGRSATVLRECSARFHEPGHRRPVRGRPMTAFPSTMCRRPCAATYRRASGDTDVRSSRATHRRSSGQRSSQATHRRPSEAIRQRPSGDTGRRSCETVRPFGTTHQRYGKAITSGPSGTAGDSHSPPREYAMTGVHPEPAGPECQRRSSRSVSASLSVCLAWTSGSSND